MSTSSRMYDRLCKLYHLVLVRMRKLEAVRAFPPLSQLRRSVVSAVAGHRLEQLEPRVLLSGAPTLPGMHLSSDDTSNWQGQVIFLDFDGAQDVVYDGPVQIGPFDVDAFQAPAGQAGQETTIAADVLSHLQTTFADTGVTFTLIEPEEGDYSILYVGGDDTAFHAHGRFTALAEGVDEGNQNPSDEAWVFSQGLATNAQLIELVQHEVGHLLGYAHEQTSTHQGLLADLAVNDLTILGPALVNQDGKTMRFTIVRSDISAEQTFHVSTLDDLGDQNQGQYVTRTDYAITFAAGQNTSQVIVILNDLGLRDGSATFRLVVHEASGDPNSQVLASSDFTIVNNSTGDFSLRYLTSIYAANAGIVDHLPALQDNGVRMLALQIGQGPEALTAEKAALIQAAGLQVISVYHQQGMSDTDSLGNPSYAWQDYFTLAQGQADAEAAYLAATQVAQQPFDSAIYFAIDLNPANTSGMTSAQALDAISQYFQGIQDYFNTLPAQARYKIGVMGAGDTLTRITNDGLADYVWLAASSSWPGYGDWYVQADVPGKTNLRQVSDPTQNGSYGGIAHSINYSRINPSGAWHEVITPEISVSAATLNLTYYTQTANALSATVTLLARHLTDGDTITVTAPEGFEMALFTSGQSQVYTQSLTFTSADGFLYERIVVRATALAIDHPLGELVFSSALDSSLNKTIHLTSEIWDHLDNSAPVVETWSASASTIPSGSPVTLAYTVSDKGGAGLASVSIQRAPDNNGVPGAFSTIQIASVGTLPRSEDLLYSNVHVDTPADGKWWYRIRVTDLRQNTSAYTDTNLLIHVGEVAPVITGISPAAGSIQGGTQVTITGRNFSDASSVYFGDTPAASFTVDSDTQITAITAATSNPGSVEVKVVSPLGNSSSTLAAQYQYLPPLPNLTTHVPQGWAAALVISKQSGTHVNDSQIDSDDALFMDWSLINQGEAEILVPFDITLLIDGQVHAQWQSDATLQVDGTLSIEDYALGALSKGQHTLQLIIDASNVILESNEADNIISRTLNVAAAPDVTAPVIHSFTSSVPAVALGGHFDIHYTVSDAGGAGLYQVQLFRNISPSSSGSLISTQTLSGDGPITGSFDVTQSNSGSYYYDLKVVDQSGNTVFARNVGSGPIQVAAALPPHLNNITPARGSIEGGGVIKLTGTFLEYATAVHFGDTPATSFTVNPDGSITAIAPPQDAAGVVYVRVTTPGGITPIGGVNDDKFTYYEPVLPNLARHKIEGWKQHVILSHDPGSLVTTNLNVDEDILVSWAYINDSEHDINTPFKILMTVDDQRFEWTITWPLPSGQVLHIADFNIGKLPKGDYAVFVYGDTADDLDETLENDNNSSWFFRVGNESPTIHELTPGERGQSLLSINYTISDPDSDEVSILPEYSIDGGNTWHPATLFVPSSGGGTSGLDTTPEPTAYRFVWNVEADLGDMRYEDALFRLTPYDRWDKGQTVTSGPFQINQPPILDTINLTVGQYEVIELNWNLFENAIQDDVGDVLKFVKIDSTPDMGHLELNGVRVTKGQEIAVDASNLLTYHANTSSPQLTTFRWNGSDGERYATLTDLVRIHITPQPAYDTTFDFGSATSPLQAGALRVSENTTYNIAQGYGWQSGAIVSRDRGSSTDMNRDLNATSDGTFAVDLATGYYKVTVHLGDVANYQHDQMGVYIEDALVESVTSPIGQVVTRSYVVRVSDGQLNLRLEDLGGVDPSVIITGLRIQNSSPPVAHDPIVSDISISLDQDNSVALTAGVFSAAFSDLNVGDSLQKIRIITLPAHGQLLLAGNVVAAGQEITVSQLASLIYIPSAGYTGPDSFRWNASDGGLYAENDAQVNLTITAPAAYDVTFDFGTSSSPLQAGATRVAENTTYNSSRGYGWQTTGIVSRDRGGSSALNRDFNATNDGTFAVDLANGFYSVTVHLGDTDPYVRDQMGVFLEGAQVDSVTAPLGQIATRTYSVQVIDGQFNLRLKDLGGNDPTAVIAGLRIVSSEPPAAAPPVVSAISVNVEVGFTLLLSANHFLAAFSDPNPGDSLQKIKIVTLPGQGVLKLSDQPVLVNQEISVNDLGDLTYTPNQFVPTVDSFTWTASDGNQFALVPATYTITTRDSLAYDTTFDFGTASSPLQSGAERVTEGTSYNSSRGYGWQTSGIVSRDRGASSGSTSLSRDFNATGDGTFAVDLANGYYKVTLTLGDADPYPRDQMGVHLEGTLVDSVSTASGEIVERVYVVRVTDGQLNIRLKDLGGSDPSIVIAGLRIQNTAEPLPQPPVVTDIQKQIIENTPAAFSAGDFEVGFNDPNVGDTLDKIRIVSLPKHGQLTFNGQAVSLNQEISSSQLPLLVYTPASGFIGSDGFFWNGADATSYAQLDAEVVLEIIAPPLYQVTFDFGTSSSSLQSGALRVSENTLYNASRGYGWQSGLIVSRDRGGSTAMNRDLNATADGTFAVDLENGQYEVTVHLGDVASYQHDQMGVYLEGVLKESVTPPLGQVVTRTYQVQVVDGQLTLRLVDLGGIDPSVIIAGLDIREWRD